MNETVKVTFSIDWDLLKEFDNLLKRKGLENRSKVIRDLIDDFLITEKIKQSKINKEIEGTFAIIAKSNAPLQVENYPYITIPINSDYLTFVILPKATYKEAEAKFKSIKEENTLRSCQLIQI